MVKLIFLLNCELADVAGSAINLDKNPCGGFEFVPKIVLIFDCVNEKVELPKYQGKTILNEEVVLTVEAPSLT